MRISLFANFLDHLGHLLNYFFQMAIFMATITFLALLVSTIPCQGGRLDETFVVPALGRAFTLGMLYNARTDKIIPGRSVAPVGLLKNPISSHKFP